MERYLNRPWNMADKQGTRQYFFYITYYNTITVPKHSMLGPRNYSSMINKLKHRTEKIWRRWWQSYRNEQTTFHILSAIFWGAAAVREDSWKERFFIIVAISLGRSFADDKIGVGHLATCDSDSLFSTQKWNIRRFF